MIPRALFSLLACILAAPSFSATIYVKKGGGGDGTSWATPFGRVGDALAAASSGDEVWVARGTYTENVVLPGGVGLCGGFNGTETSLDDRVTRYGDPPTALDGGGVGSVITVAPDAPATTVIDGFQIRNGTGTAAGQSPAVYGGGILCGPRSAPMIRLNDIQKNEVSGSGTGYGGGVYCAPGSRPTLLWNTITANTADEGGGVYVDAAFPLMDHNNFRTNSATGNGGALAINTGGVASDGRSPIVARNFFNGNSAAQRGSALSVKGNGLAQNPVQIFSNLIYGETSIPYAPNVVVSLDGDVDLVNNTIVNNRLTAVSVAAARTIANNIITGNLAGLNAPAALADSIRCNDVFNNTAGNYLTVADQTGRNGNVSVDPGFGPNVGAIGANSALVDAGSNDALPQGAVFATDIQDHARISGPRVDIGANEVTPQLVFSPGLLPRYSAGQPFTPPIQVRVVDQDNRLFARFQGDVTIALKPGSGTAGAGLSGTVTVPLIGGVATFTGVSVTRGGVDYRLTASVPGAAAIESAPFTVSLPRVYVSASSGNDSNEGGSWADAKQRVSTALRGVEYGAGEVWVAGGDYANGRLSIQFGVGLYGGFAGNETAREQRAPWIHETIIRGGVDIQPHAGDVPVTVDGFTITDGVGYFNATGPGYAEYLGGGVAIFSSTATISHNVVKGNRANFGGGIYANNAKASIFNNVITGNTAAPDPGGINDRGVGGGAFLAIVSDGPADAASAPFANNTIVGNTATQGGGGVSWTPGAGAARALSNNIIAFNNSGLRVVSTPNNPILSHNLVYGNDTNYTGVPDPTGTAGNLSVDPLFQNREAGNFRLNVLSPAIDAGLDGNFGVIDLDGNPRRLGARTDIGAYEFVPVAQAAASALRIAGGLNSWGSDQSRLDVTGDNGPDGVVDVRDAIALLRSALGGGAP